MRFSRTIKGMRITPLNRIKNSPHFDFFRLMLQNTPAMAPHSHHAFYRHPYRSAFFLTASVIPFYYLGHYTGVNQAITHMISPPFLNSFPEQKENDPFKTYPALTSVGVTDPTYINILEIYLRTFFFNCKPDLFSISEILSWNAKLKTQTNTDLLKYYILEGCDSSVTPSFPAMDGGIRQIASQFNFGESPDRKLTHPKEFQFDHTQGPTEQNTAKVTALFRWIYRNKLDGMSNLQSHHTFHQLFDYQCGYLTPRLGCEAQGLAFLKAHVGKIKLNVQRVGIDGTNQTVIQVLNAGLALGPYDADREKRTVAGNEAIRQMSNLLLTEQFKAVATVTVKEAQQNPEKRIPVTFTPVGGGVYGNNPDSIKAALSAACDLIEQSRVTNIDVCLSAYQPGEADLFKSKHFANAPVLDQEALSQLKNLSDYSSEQLNSLPQMI